MPEQVICELCSRAIDVHTSYIVRIDVFANPSVPPLSQEDLAGGDFEQTMQDLLEQMKDMSAEELQDGVHRRFEYRLCHACHQEFLSNPLGMPRRNRTGQN